MKFGFHGVNALVRAAFRLVCRVDKSELARIPATGPLILIGNHINFLETPVFLAWMDNPAITGIAKRETWKNPLFYFLFNVWEIIPIDRGTVDREAFRLSFEALAKGKILALSPEGTRSKDGRLLKGKPGISYLAARSAATVVPVAFWGHENFWLNLKHLRRTDLHITVGQPFRLTAEAGGIARDVREAVADEMMFKIAELLPEKNRGMYAFSEPVKYRYLVPAESS